MKYVKSSASDKKYSSTLTGDFAKCGVEFHRGLTYGNPRTSQSGERCQLPESRIAARGGSKSMALGPPHLGPCGLVMRWHRAVCFSKPVYTGQCFLNLYIASVLPLCLLLHHLLQLPATREDHTPPAKLRLTLRSPPLPPSWSPDTTIRPIASSVKMHCHLLTRPGHHIDPPVRSLHSSPHSSLPTSNFARY